MFSRRSRLAVGFTLAGWALALSAGVVMAHDGGPHTAGPWWAAWSLEPLVILLLAGSVLLYARGWRVMAGRAGRTEAALRRRTWVFGAGIAVLAVALLSPVDAMAGQLFWVHMVQHNLLMLVAAPLLVFAYPLPPLLLGLPAGARRWLGQGWSQHSLLRRLWSLVSSPLAAWLLQASLLWTWHSPVFYQASVANESVHALQHLSFMGSALLFWWVTLHTLAAHSAYRGAAILYVFTTALHSGFLGALLTFSPRLWYPIYAGRAEQWGLTALADQQLAGTIMWVPSGMVYLLAALWLMKAWLDSFELREEPVLKKEG